MVCNIRRIDYLPLYTILNISYTLLAIYANISMNMLDKKFSLVRYHGTIPARVAINVCRNLSITDNSIASQYGCDKIHYICNADSQKHNSTIVFHSRKSETLA